MDGAAGRSELSPSGTGAAVAIPVAIFLLSMWLLHKEAREAFVRRLAVPVVLLMVLAASLSPSPVLVVGLLMAGLVAVKIALRMRQDAPAR